MSSAGKVWTGEESPPTSRRVRAQDPQGQERSMVRFASPRAARPSSRLLTTQNILRFQRTIGNRAVVGVINRTLQRAPVKVKDKSDGNVTSTTTGEGKTNIRTDTKYHDVRFEKLHHATFKILNDGPHKNDIVRYCYDDARYYYAKPKEEEEEFYETDYRRPFDIATVSSLRPAPEEVTKYSGIGEDGQGVGNVRLRTTLHTSGLITCVGWLLYNDVAAYLTHILVEGDPRKIVADGTIKKQVEQLCETFAGKAGKAPTNVCICVDREQKAYEDEGIWMKGWMRELVPSSCEVAWQRVAGAMSHDVIPNTGRDRVEWKGRPIKVSYA